MYQLYRDFNLVKKGPKNSGMGKPPSPLFGQCPKENVLLFMISSLSQNISGRLGSTVNLISYSLLIDFITDFFRNGVTMKGIHMSHTSKCVMKCGMKHLDKLESLAQCLRRVNHQHFQHQQKQCFLLHFLWSKASCPGDRWYCH